MCRKRVERLMKAVGIAGVSRKCARTTFRDEPGQAPRRNTGQHLVADPDEAKADYDMAIAEGLWRPDAYPPPPYYYPEGIETPKTLQHLTARLLDRGFGEEDVQKILGLNWMRIYRSVWDG